MYMNKMCYFHVLHTCTKFPQPKNNNKNTGINLEFRKKHKEKKIVMLNVSNTTIEKSIRTKCAYCHVLHTCV